MFIELLYKNTYTHCVYGPGIYITFQLTKLASKLTYADQLPGL